jgi:hypothetical protein
VFGLGSIGGETARLAAAQGEVERAAAAWQKRLTLDPTDREALDALVDQAAAGDNSELLIEALRLRARIVEVPITIRARQAGESKKPPALKYGWHFTKAIVKTWLR